MSLSEASSSGDEVPWEMDYRNPRYVTNSDSDEPCGRTNRCRNPMYVDYLQWGSDAYDSDEACGETNLCTLLDVIGVMPLTPDRKTRKRKVLDEKNIHGVIKYIKEGKCKTIITMAGAGISTSSGIPDFRSPGSGIHHILQKYNLSNPEAIFEIDFFKENPEVFFQIVKQLYPENLKPTICHCFVKLLHEKGLLLRHYTQNIDTLERVAGIPEEVLVEAHGTFHTSHCLECNKEYTSEWMKERISKEEVPRCEKCEHLVKPDLVFFGENLPAKFYKYITEDFEKCDLLIIMGSSLTVQPFACLIDKVPKTCARLLVNRMRAGEFNPPRTHPWQGSGMDFDTQENTRDVAWLGDCDDGCELLANELGWGDELRQLFKPKPEEDMSAMVNQMKTLSVQGETSVDNQEGKKE